MTATIWIRRWERSKTKTSMHAHAESEYRERNIHNNSANTLSIIPLLLADQKYHKHANIHKVATDKKFVYTPPPKKSEVGRCVPSSRCSRQNNGDWLSFPPPQRTFVRVQQWRQVSSERTSSQGRVLERISKTCNPHNGFADPNAVGWVVVGRADTLRIERSWKAAKEHSKHHYGTQRHMPDSYIRENSRGESALRFIQLKSLENITQIILYFLATHLIYWILYSTDKIDSYRYELIRCFRSTSCWTISELFCRT